MPGNYERYFRLNTLKYLCNDIFLSIFKVGDGTTSVVLLAGEFLKVCKPFIEEGVHPQIIIRSFRQAVASAVAKLKEIAVTLDKNNPEKLKELLMRCAATTLSSKVLMRICISTCRYILIECMETALTPVCFSWFLLLLFIYYY